MFHYDSVGITCGRHVSTFLHCFYFSATLYDSTGTSNFSFLCLQFLAFPELGIDVRGFFLQHNKMIIAKILSIWPTVRFLKISSHYTIPCHTKEEKMKRYTTVRSRCIFIYWWISEKLCGKIALHL